MIGADRIQAARRLLAAVVVAATILPSSSGFAKLDSSPQASFPDQVLSNDDKDAVSITGISEASNEPQTSEASDAPPWVLFPRESVVDRGFSIDYRYRALCDSRMAYEIGTANLPPTGYSPLSMLEFPINSSWTGLQVGVDRPNWGLHCEWLTAMTQSIDGRFEDYDWRESDRAYTDLGYGPQRWNDAQMVNLDLERKMTDRFFGLPIEVWPTVGFRWERLDVTAHDLDQVLWQGQPISDHYAGDVLTYDQQYYICYVGGQLRRAVYIGGQEIRLTFQGDWGYTWAYGVDHHILRSFYGLNQTQGDSWHVGLTAEAPLSQRFSVGVQGDFLSIRTTGKTWEAYDNGSAGPSWTNGVCAYSDQTMITAFARLHY
jgi:hypothetical protein